MIRLAVRVRREDAEVVLAELLELAPSGVEEAELEEGLVEYAVYGSPGELPELPDLRAAAGEALVEVTTSELPEDWSERWKHFHRPVLIEPPGVRSPSEQGSRPSPRRQSRAGSGSVPGLHVRPPWEPPRERADVEEIVIDPGQAFGTGAHASTRLCLELLLELAASAALEATELAASEALEATGHAASAALEPAAVTPGLRGPLLDLGTGSGVLAIAAARLGFAPVLGLDNERESVEAARENVKVNGVEVEVQSFDLRRGRLPPVGGVAAPTVLANLLRPLLLDLARSIEQAPADLIVGGMLVEEVDEVLGAFSEHLGLRARERRRSGEWAAAWLQAGAWSGGGE